MNWKPFAAALLLTLACTTLAAPSEEEQMKTMCGNVARINADICYKVAAPTVKDPQSKVFAVQVCTATAREALAMCLDTKAWAKYEEMPGCAGVQAFTKDAIAAGGAKVVAARPEAERAKRQEQADYWATAGSVNIFKACLRDQAEEDRQKNGPFANPQTMDL